MEPDSPLFRAILLQQERRATRLRTHLKTIIKECGRSVNELQIASNSLDSLDQTLSLLSLNSSNSEILGGIFERELLAEREKARRSRKSEIEILQLCASELKDAYSRLEEIGGKKNIFEAESKSFYKALAEFLATKAIPDSKEESALDSKQNTLVDHFASVRFNYLGFLEGIVAESESTVASCLRSFARVSNTPAVPIKRNRSLEQTAIDIGVKMMDLDNLPTLEDISDGVSDGGTASASASGGSGFSLQSKEEKTSKRMSLPVDRFKGFIKNVKESLHSSSPIPPIPSIDTPPRPSPPLPATPTFIVLPPSPHPARPPTAKQPPTARELALSAARKKEGFLFSRNVHEIGHTQAGDGSGSWHKMWTVLSEGQIVEFGNWKSTLSVRNTPIHLSQASVRISKNSDRRFCFEVLTINSRHVYQATNSQERNEWITAISNSIESLLNGTSTVRRVFEQPSNSNRLPGWLGEPLLNRRASLGSGKRKSKVEESEQVSNRSISGPLPFKSSSSAKIEDVSSRLSATGRFNAHDRKIEQLVNTLVPTLTADQILEMKMQNSIEIHRLSELEENSCCADCGAPDASWTSFSLGIFICIRCAGIHRGLGTHISKVRSVDLDSWNDEQLQQMRAIGNARGKEIYEFNRPTGIVVKDSTITAFIHSKYVDQIWFKEPPRLPLPLSRPRPFSLPVTARSTSISDAFKSTTNRS